MFLAVRCKLLKQSPVVLASRCLSGGRVRSKRANSLTSALWSVKRSNSSKAAKSASPDASNSASDASVKEKSGTGGFFSEERITASKNFNRWWLVPAALGTHLSLGSVFAWSLLNGPLTKELGVVASASSDWSLSSVVRVFSVILALQGISAALAGKWQERVGVRATCLLGAAFFGGGIALGGVGVCMHNLPLLYAGYGILGGIGVGLSYAPPVATLLRWFPDRRGFATGMVICGFGGGALIAGPAKTWLLHYFQRVPDFLGTADAVRVVTEGGKRMAEVAGQLREVVVLGANDLASSGFSGLQEGVYVVGTGNTGAGSTLIVMGLSYLSVMAVAALSYKNPPAGYKPPGYAPAVSNMVSRASVHVDDVMRTPQFWKLWFTFFSLSSAGLAVISVAKTLMADVFGTALPLIVTGGFASGYVLSLSVVNLGGRLLWASVSDVVGRKNIFALFCCVSVPLYCLIPWSAQTVSVSASVFPLAVFYGATLLSFSFFGAGYSTVPAYEADLFGSKFVGAVHGRMLTASSMASLVGPEGLTYLRERAMSSALKDLTAKCDPEVFLQKFGAPVSQLEQLASNKVVTISRLMEIAPASTVDPTPLLYNTTMYSAASLLAVAAFVNFLVKPVDPKFHMIPSDEERRTLLKESALLVSLICQRTEASGATLADVAGQQKRLFVLADDNDKCALYYALNALEGTKESLPVSIVYFSTRDTADAQKDLIAMLVEAQKAQIPCDGVLCSGQFSASFLKDLDATNLVLPASLLGLPSGSDASSCEESLDGFELGTQNAFVVESERKIIVPKSGDPEVSWKTINNEQLSCRLVSESGRE